MLPTGQVVAATLTTNDVDDGTQVGTLLDQVDGPIASFTADGAYDQDGVYGEIAERHPDAAVIVPPRSSVPATAFTRRCCPHARACTLPAIPGNRRRWLIERHGFIGPA